MIPALDSPGFARMERGRGGAFLVLALMLLAAGCSHRQPHQKVIELDAQLSGRLGRARQADVLELMGEPTAVDRIGEIEVWVYQYEVSGGTMHRKPDLDVVAPVHDELLLTFDQAGILQKYQAIIEGRSSRREKSR